MARKIAIGGFIILSVALGYFWLGGGQNLEFQIVEKSEFYILGYDYTGSYKNPKLEKIFYTAREESKSSQSDLMVINYDHDTLDESHIHQLIGVVSNKSDDVRDEKKMIKLESGKYIQTVINAHNLVMPKPEDVREQAEKIAVQNRLEISNISIEVYKGERELVIMYPAKEI